MYRIRLLEAANGELARLDKTAGRRMVARLNWLAENVDEMTHEALKGELAGLYKLRVGAYRVIYEILRHEESVVVHAIGHRRDIYRSR